jgi:hypothetical protein
MTYGVFQDERGPMREIYLFFHFLKINLEKNSVENIANFQAVISLNRLIWDDMG